MRRPSCCNDIKLRSINYRLSLVFFLYITLLTWQQLPLLEIILSDSLASNRSVQCLDSLAITYDYLTTLFIVTYPHTASCTHRREAIRQRYLEKQKWKRKQMFRKLIRTETYYDKTCRYWYSCAPYVTTFLYVKGRVEDH